MTPHKISASFLRLVPVFAAAATALAGCSTVKSISPFGSNVPYASAVQPTIARPAVTEIPAYKPKPEPPPAPKPAPPPPPPPPPSPAAAPASKAPAPAAPPPPAEAEPPLPAPLPEKASQADLDAPRVAQAATAPTPSPSPAPVPPPAAAGKPAAPAQVADESAAPSKGDDRDAGQGPSIPAADRKLSDDGAYPNLAQVPARPVNLPTFAEAAALEKTLVADREKAKDPEPASPAAPAVDSAVVPVPVPAAKPGAPSAAAPAEVAARPEDSAPCLNMKTVSGDLAATLHFDPGSAALTTGNRNILAEAIPVVRAAKGTIRIFGHGDSETGVASARFDLAAARAAAVAQALAGYGIPAPRIAVGVACADAAFAGASVQLYAES
jgi:outer membrane protein OmpA-like peptidoglycan-associated protein